MPMNWKDSQKQGKGAVVPAHKGSERHTVVKGGKARTSKNVKGSKGKY